MMDECGFSRIGRTDISQNVTIVPRLDYSNNLLCRIIDILKMKRSELKKSNRIILSESDLDERMCRKTLDVEKIIAFSVEILIQIQKRTTMISGITSISEILPSAIPVIRTISAQLYDIIPECSQKLSELSVHLGSIVFDSATLTKASFDFSLSNEKYAILLDEVKLMVDSKINKQYPNLNFLKA